MSANELNEICCNIRPILKAINLMLEIVKWSVPLLLIVLGTIDMFKAVLSGDEKVVKETQESFIKRLLYGVLIFLIPFLVDLVLSLISDNIQVDNQGLTDMNSWAACWKPAVNDELTCVVEEEPEDNQNDSENIDNGSNQEDTPITKTCYSYIGSSNCRTQILRETIEGNKGENSYIDSFGEPYFLNEKCAINITLLEGYTGHCNTICTQKLNGSMISNDGVCKCSYQADSTRVYSNDRPSSTYDGKVDIYKCPMSGSCSSSGIGLCDFVRQEEVATR